MKSYFLVCILLSIHSFAQEVKIRGVVSDESGPLPGAIVIIKNSTIGTETNFDGEYEITAQIGDTLVISFIGFKTKEIIVTDTKAIDVELTIDVLLESPSFCCCIPLTSLTTNYYSGLNYTPLGLQLNLRNLYKLRQSFNITLGYAVDFKKNELFDIEIKHNNSFYIGTSISTSFKLRSFDIKEQAFNFRDYQLVFDSYLKTVFQRFATNVSLGITMSELNEDKNMGIALGIRQNLISNFAISFKSILSEKYTEIHPGIHFYYKRFILELSYNKIAVYEDYTVALGYTFYL